MKLVLAVPTYGPVEPKASRYLRASMMWAGNHGVTWVSDASPDKQTHAAARNHVVTEVISAFSEEEVDAICWVDSDIILAPESIARLAQYVGKQHPGTGESMEFVSGVYFQRGAPHCPLFGTFNEKGRSFSWALEFPIENPEIGPVEGIGFGFCITSTKMLRAMLTSEHAKKWKCGELFEYAEFSEDLTFCIRARQCGFRPYIDTGVLCGHLGDPAIITVDTFQPFAERLKNAGRIVRVMKPGETVVR